MARTKAAELPIFNQGTTTCCYAKADKFWVRDADGVAWEMYSLLEDVESETASDRSLRAFLGQESAADAAEQAGSCATADCCVPKGLQ
jgi:hypothetical protein